MIAAPNFIAMIDDHKTTLDKIALDLDDDEILTKLDLLLSKYQNQNNSAMNANNTGLSSMPTQDHVISKKSSKRINDGIPILTEIVMLRTKMGHSQPERLSPLQRILDDALAEVKIDINTTDRGALIRALEKHLAKKPSE